MVRQEITWICQAVKSELRRAKRSYAEVGAELGVSEVTVRRWLSGNSVRLDQLMELCDALGLPFFDLIEIARRRRIKAQYLTPEQDQFFADNPKCYWLFMRLRKRLDEGEIRKRSGISKRTFNQLFAQLEEHGLVYVTERGDIRPFTYELIWWPPGGEMARRHGVAQCERFARDFHEGLEALDEKEVLTGVYNLRISKREYTRFIRELRSLHEEFCHIAQRDETSAPRQQLQLVRWQLIARPIEEAWDDAYWLQEAN